MSNSARLEQRLLVTCLETRDPALQQMILDQTSTEDFTTAEARNLHRHFEHLLYVGKPLGRAVDMAEDADLCRRKEAAFILALPEVRQKCREYSVKQVREMLDQFHDRVQTRKQILIEGIKQVASLAGADDVLEQATAVLEGMQERIRKTSQGDCSTMKATEELDGFAADRAAMLSRAKALLADVNATELHTPGEQILLARTLIEAARECRMVENDVPAEPRMPRSTEWSAGSI